MSERFELAKASDLHQDLSLPEGKNPKVRKAALRKVVSNMTVSNPEMLSLFPDIIHCMKSNDLEIKRMCFLYLETYAKSRPQQAADALQQLKREVMNKESSPVVRAIALRAMSSVPAKIYANASLDALPECLKSPDSYLRKTACFAASKVWAIIPEIMEKGDVLQRLNQMLAREQSPVVAAAAAQSLMSITDSSRSMQFVIDFQTSQRLAHMLSECPEFSQVSILSAMSMFVPQAAEEAEKLAELVVPGLRHTNAAVAVGSARVLLMLSHYSPILSEVALEQIFAPLLSQLNRPPEIQYAVLRNIQLILQSLDHDTLSKLRIPPQAFFCRASDVSYIRSTKIDILSALCTTKNSDMVINELLEFTKIRDPEATRRAITVLGSIGMRYDDVAPFCVRELKKFLAAEPQAVTSLISLIRRYPSNTRLVASTLESLWTLEDIPEEEEARESYIWLLGAYYKHGAHATKILAGLIDNFANEPLGVQYALFTACIRIFVRFPQDTQGLLVPRIFEIAANSSSHPDIRERALIYWRILSVSPIKMAAIVNHNLPPVVKDVGPDSNCQEDLELSLGYLSSIYLKPSDQLFRVAHSRQLKPSKALLPRKRKPEDEDHSTVHFSSSQFTGNLAHMVTSPSSHGNFENRASSQSMGYFTPQSPQSPLSELQVNHSGKFPPPPPAPRPLAHRQTSLQTQFSGMHLNSAFQEDQSERLIDI